MVRARAAEPEDKYQVWDSKELVRDKRSNEAREILTRVIKQVQPLMRRRRWRVKMVREVSETNEKKASSNQQQHDQLTSFSFVTGTFPFPSSTLKIRVYLG